MVVPRSSNSTCSRATRRRSPRRRIPARSRITFVSHGRSDWSASGARRQAAIQDSWNKVVGVVGVAGERPREARQPRRIGEKLFCIWRCAHIVILPRVTKALAKCAC